MRWCRARMPRPRSRSRRCSRSCPIDSTSSWRSSGTSRRPRSPRSTGCCATSTSRQWGREAGSGENRTGEGRRERYVTLVVTALAAALLAGGDTLSGRVADRDGRPVAGAMVVVSELHRVALTRSDGAFLFAAVPAGRYTVTARARGGGLRPHVADPVTGAHAAVARAGHRHGDPRPARHWVLAAAHRRAV